MKSYLLRLWIIGSMLTAWAQGNVQDRLEKAAGLYEEGSFKLAHEAYSSLPMAQIPPEQQRWVRFRTADSLWRSEKSTERSDATQVEKALQVLRELTAESAAKDAIWAEANESLGDFHWVTRHSRNWGGAWPHYQKALDYWAGSTDLNRAAEEYLQIVWKSSRPPETPEPYYYGHYGNQLPADVLENAVRLARTEEERARAHFLLALSLRYEGGPWENRRSIPRHFEEAIKLKRDTEWYDDALYHYAEWMSSQGRPVRDEHGNWRFEPDYPKGLELFRRIVAEYSEGETRYWQQARQQIASITRVEVRPQVPHFFAPAAKVSFQVSWRNVERIDFSLHKIRLLDHLRLQGGRAHEDNWLDAISPEEKVKSWTRETADTGKHIPGSETITLEDELKPGAYLLTASAGGVSSRELILVTDVSLIVKSSGSRALVYLCSAREGSPMPAGTVAIWVRSRENNVWTWHRYGKETDEQGLAEFDLSRHPGRDLIYAAAAKGEQQAFSQVSAWGHHSEDTEWRIYAYTDRPAYRPGETVKWKLTARERAADGYGNPSSKKLKVKITDPRGAEVKALEVKLNSFGSAWGELDLKGEMPLGQYHVSFSDLNDRVVGQAPLFQLEEYKLPEFKVSISTPREDGRRKTFLLGETVEVEVQADYYFGGPVANATVEVVVRQAPFYHHWRPDDEFDWFLETEEPRRYHNPGQEVQRETLQTDASGKAILKLRTAATGNQDLQYQIEARATDASRREVTATESVRVTNQRYYVRAQPGHYLHRPQEEVEVEFKALDANDQPVQAEGMVRITRDRWVEIWVNPEGQEVRGRALDQLRQAGHFPPSGVPAWRLKFRGYEHDHVLTRTVKTGTNGLAELSFTPEREGFYRITWRSEDDVDASQEIAGRPVSAETTVWVANNTSTHLGYHTGGVEIIVDKGTFRAGATAPVMLVTSGNNRHVLFAVEGTELISRQLVHLEGSVKLLHIPLNEEHVPNVQLTAAMVSDYRIHMDNEEVTVPPIQQFLTLELEPDKSEYLPAEKAAYTLRLTDYQGKPVQGEIALSVVDESVFYIQQDLAGDPRKFFYGERRQYGVQTQSSFSFRSYLSREQQEELDLLEVRRGDRMESLNRFSFYDESLGKASQAKVPSGAFLATAAAPASRAVAEGKAERRDMMVGDRLQVGNDAEASAVQVRSDFRTSIFWQPDLVTDADGRARVSLQYPDSLTGWKATARAGTVNNQFGIASSTTRTKKPLIVRLQAPRFFLVGDSVIISAVLNNNTDQSMEVLPSLEVEGIAQPENIHRSPLSVPAGGERRVDWVVRPQKAGEAKITVTARAGTQSDAMQRSYPVFEHGIEKFLAISGKVRGDEVTVALDLPIERKPGSTSMTVQITPSLAVTMLDALPYLVHYPYGCTEQTMSRFLPAVITANTLEKLGLPPEDAMSRAFGGIEQQFASRSQPGGRKNLEKLDEIVRAGLQRLYDFQHADGGWGWWKEGDSDPFMTAYVLWGLLLARDAEVEIREPVIDRAADWLQKQLVSAERSFDLQAWMLHALSVRHALEKQQSIHRFENAALDNLWNNREQLNAYTRALLALSAHAYGKPMEAATLVRNLENGVKLDSSPSTSILVKSSNASETEMATAHWGEDGIFWRWSDGGVEATAFVLKALVTIDPEHKLVEPVTNWLIKNRRGAQWSNTRDTAISLLALNDYLRQSGELETELEYQLQVNGTTVAEKKVTKSDVFSAPSRFAVPAELIRSRKNEIRIVRQSGKGPLYFAAEAEFFSLEEPIRAAGNEVFAKREYYRLKATPTLLKGFVYSKEKLADGAKVESGDRLEVVLTVEAKNNYEYLVFEDLKPAGLEAVEVRSGQPLYAHELKSSAVEERHGKTLANSRSSEPVVRQQQLHDGQTGRSRWVYQELRDRKVALFLDKLPQGVWEIRYEVRAETPGEFHALPVLGHAMYVPEIRCNSDETHLIVTDPPAVQPES